MSRRTYLVHAAELAVAAAACGPPELAAPPPNTFAFAVFGDGPYRSWETGRFRRLIGDVNRADLRFFLHVGDVLWYPCSDTTLAGRLRALNTIRHPVIYTPGDNEWADCHERLAGGYRPLERLSFIRHTWFAEPERSLGGRALRLESQSAEPAWTEFVENARWILGGFLFATLHLVGSGNASDSFPGRGAADDADVARRTEAAMAWLDAAFSIAARDSLSGIVIAMHGDPGFEAPRAERPAYAAFLDRLELRVSEFPGPVVLIHGDSHTYLVDHPLHRGETGEPFANFTRLETFGSPEIGWVRVVVDSVAGRVVGFEPRVMPRRLFW